MKRIFLYLGIILLFLYILFYPFGNLIIDNIKIFNIDINIHPIDIIALFSIPLFILSKYKRPVYYFYLMDFIYIAIFSNLISIVFIPYKSVFLGSLYLIRLISYIVFSVVIWNVIIIFPKLKIYLNKVIFIIILLISILGWLQYFFYFDMRVLEYSGWDNHYGRITAPFLDPTYTSVILLLGLIFIFKFYLIKRKKIFILFLILILITILFTYSRATIFTLLIIAGIELIKLMKKKGLILLTAIILAIFLLPRIASEGTRLERTQSIIQRVQNYKETSSIYIQKPIFGWGFSNLCYLRYTRSGGNINSHSCSGSDSSILFILATTGLVGFLVLANIIKNISLHLKNNIYSNILKLSFLSVFIHSFFANSIFYSYIMGWFSILLALAFEEITEKK